MSVKRTERASARARWGAGGRDDLMPDEAARTTEEEALQLAGFGVGEGIYGIDIMRIKEVIQAAPHPVRRVPHAPPLVEGVIALRGTVIPVIDLRTRFGTVADPNLIRFNKLVIVSVRGRIVALRIDRIIGELRVPVSGVRPTPAMLRPLGHENSDFFTGVCKMGDNMVFVVNLETVIDPTIANPERRLDATVAVISQEETRDG